MRKNNRERTKTAVEQLRKKIIRRRKTKNRTNRATDRSQEKKGGKECEDITAKLEKQREKKNDVMHKRHDVWLRKKGRRTKRMEGEGTEAKGGEQNQRDDDHITCALREDVSRGANSVCFFVVAT